MSRKRILVVDDEPAVGDSITVILELDGHNVEFVTSALQALEKYEVGKYDVILADHRMPGMTGLELAERIKSQNPKQPIVLITGFPPGGPSPFLDLVLRKPFSGDELRRAVLNLTGAAS